MKLALSTRIFGSNCPADACIDMAARIGYQCLELRTDRFQLPVDADAACVAHIKRTAQNAGIAISSIASFTGHYAGRSDEDCAKELHAFTKLAQIAAELGAENIRHWAGNWGISSADASEDDWKRAAEWMHRACEVSEKYGVYPSDEIHFNTICDTLDSAVKLCKLTDHPRLRFTVDFQNLYFQNEPYTEEIYKRIPVERIANVHFKDAILLQPDSPCPEPYVCNGRNYAFRPLNQGSIDNWAALNALKKTGYQKCITIETGFGSPRDAYFLAQYEYSELRKMAEALNCLDE